MPIPKPTDAELRILTALWAHGPSTVRAVHERLSESQDVGYTTVLKLLQIMTEKGLVKRDTRKRPQVYAARRSEEATQRQMVGGLLDRAFGGSTAKLIQRALSERAVSKDVVYHRSPSWYVSTTSAIFLPARSKTLNRTIPGPER